MENGRNMKHISLIPVEPRRIAMALHPQVMELVAAMRVKDGYEVDYDEDAGTVTATCDGLAVYWAIQKGDIHQPWVVSYSTDPKYFGGHANPQEIDH